ncbi:MAG TPA: SDR family oxidoreductase [Pseudolysinimonas sp.]|nr:SDR family oxidoreductase [Pseudolysinimonas sp.]
MRIVIVGGTGLIGSRLAARLQASGDEVVIAAPSTGVDTTTGRGVAEALAGADVLVDVSNSPSFDGDAVREFFTASTRTLLDAARAAGIRHLVALSVVGTDRLAESPYFQGKIAQERLITDGEVPFTIVHATQFYEFVRSIADAATENGIVRLAPVGIQPMAADDVAAALAAIVHENPAGGVVEIAGPERWTLDELVRTGLRVRGDARPVEADPESRYFGALLATDTLLPGADARAATGSFAQWLADQEAGVASA